MQTVTKDFSRAWRLRYETHSSQLDRQWLKRDAHRRRRRAWKRAIAMGNDYAEVRPVSAWDVV